MQPFIRSRERAMERSMSETPAEVESPLSEDVGSPPAAPRKEYPKRDVQPCAARRRLMF